MVLSHARPRHGGGQAGLAMRALLYSDHVTPQLHPWSWSFSRRHLTSAYNGHRALRVGGDVLADRAEYQSREAAVAALADHQQVGVR
jgi:hypothetical protein